MPTLYQFRMEKRGNDPDECEDSIAYSAHDNSYIFAMSDGAGEAAFSREWSAILTEYVVNNPPDPNTVEDFLKWLQTSTTELHNLWVAAIPPFEALPWHGKVKFRRGSSATILFVKIEDSVMKVCAVGDSCLFHIRNAELLKAFPIDDCKEFGTRPYLINTQHGVSGDQASVAIWNTSIQENDAIILATDALAAWLLCKYTNWDRSWETILGLEQNDPTFREWIEGLRNEKEIRNDDVALVIFKNLLPTKSKENSDEDKNAIINPPTGVDFQLEPPSLPIVPPLGETSLVESEVEQASTSSAEEHVTDTDQAFSEDNHDAEEMAQ